MTAGMPFPVSSLCLVLSQFSATAAVLCLLPFYTHDDHGLSLSLSETVSPQNKLLYKLLCSQYSNRKDR